LSQQGERVFDSPALDDFAVAQTKDIDADELHLFPGRRDSPEFAPMRAGTGSPGDNLVSVRHGIVVGKVDIRKCRPQRRDRLP
jgi:hypothetical protein